MMKRVFLVAAITMLAACATTVETARAMFSEHYHCPAKTLTVKPRPDVEVWTGQQVSGCGQSVIFKCTGGETTPEYVTPSSAHCEETTWCTAPGCRLQQAATERFQIDRACPAARATITVLPYPPPPDGAESDPERLELWKNHTTSKEDTVVRVTGCDNEAVYICYQHGWSFCKMWKAPGAR